MYTDEDAPVAPLDGEGLLKAIPLVAEPLAEDAELDSLPVEAFSDELALDELSEWLGCSIEADDDAEDASDLLPLVGETDGDVIDIALDMPIDMDDALCLFVSLDEMLILVMGLLQVT